MTSKIKPITRTITLDQHIWRRLEAWASEEFRSVDNLLEWMVEQERRRRIQAWNQRAAQRERESEAQQTASSAAEPKGTT